MLCTVISGPSFSDAQRQIAKAIAESDLLELRLDLFSLFSEERDEEGLLQLQQLLAKCPLPCILTLRSASQGGGYSGAQEKQMALILRLAALKTAYLDLESSLPVSFIASVRALFAGKIIFSYHDFKQTPTDLDALYMQLKIKSKSLRKEDHYKIALAASSTVDALRLINWAKDKGDKQLIAISMGKKGQVSRLLTSFTYAYPPEEMKSAPGQLSCFELNALYRYRQFSASTAGKIRSYGLIGDPVDQSLSDRTHNWLLRSINCKARYLKMSVSKEELPLFLEQIKTLSFCGLSVTMPLKEAIIPYLDWIEPQAQAMGAVNTLILEKGRLLGFNTDGVGAVAAIEQKLSLDGAQVALLGRGGAAKAIAYAAQLKGAQVTFFSRKVDPLNAAFKVRPLADFKGEGFDLIVNCTPLSQPIDPSLIEAGATAMDINTWPKNSLFLSQAAQKGCPVIYGYEMFCAQAAYQFTLWLSLDPAQVLPDLLQKAQTLL